MNIDNNMLIGGAITLSVVGVGLLIYIKMSRKLPVEEKPKIKQSKVIAKKVIPDKKQIKEQIDKAKEPILKRNDELFKLNKSLNDKNNKLNKDINIIKSKKVREFNIVDSSYLDRLPVVKRYFERRKLNKRPDKAILIKMELNNGRHIEFIMHEDAEKSGFKFNKGRYVFDLEKKYYIISSNIWAYDFHESFTLPVERRIPVDELKSGMELAKSVVEVSHAVEPKTIERFVNTEIAQGIMRGASLGALFKMLLIIVIGVAIFELINTALGVYNSGLMEGFGK